MMATRDEVHIVWGTNRWVLVETPNESVERQVATKKELAAVLMESGLLREDAEAAAREQWKRRPRDAGTTTAGPGDSLRRATGLSQGTIALLFVVFIALFFVWAFLVRPSIGR
jgi:hypothetical protein